MTTRADAAAAPPPEEWVPRPWTVTARRAETRDTVTLTLVPPPGDRVPAPGQFMMLSAFGCGEVPISVSGLSPEGVEHTIRTVGPATTAAAAVRPGGVLGVRGPFGTGWSAATDGRDGDLVVVAGGIGLAPLRPVVQQVLGDRDRWRRVSVVAGFRRPRDVVFADDLRTWAARGDVDVQLTVDVADRSWSGHTGVVTTLVDRLDHDPVDTTVLTCGPEVMMRHAIRAVRAVGVDESDVWVSVERNMACGMALCGHCQWGPVLVCRDGPVLDARRALPLMEVRCL